MTPTTVVGSPKIIAYAALATAALLAALALRRPEPAAVAAPFLLALLLGLASAEVPALTVSARADRERLLEGEEVTVDLELTSTTPLPWLQVFPLLPDGLQAGPRAARGLSLVAGTNRHRLRARARRWGGYRLETVVVRGHDPFGCFHYEASLPIDLTLRVYPKPEAVCGALRPAETQVFSGNTVSRLQGDGIEFADVRPFVPGDRIRRINWRLSTLRGELHVNELHPERNSDVVLFLDTFSDLRLRGTGTLDLTLRAALALARHFLKEKDRVGLVGFGGVLRWLVPEMGTAQLYRILDALIDTQVVLSFAWTDVERLPPRTLPAKALVVALTPLLDGRGIEALLDLRARGFDLAVVEVSPLDFVEPLPTETGELAFRLWRLQRATLKRRFERLGVPVATWHAGDALDAALEAVRAFRRHARRQRAW